MISHRAEGTGQPTSSPAPAAPSRVDTALEYLKRATAAAAPGARVGGKGELLLASGVSPSTFNEALRVAQARGLVTSRRGPGGGIFAAPRSAVHAVAEELALVGAQSADPWYALQVAKSLGPFILEDALAAELTEAQIRALRDGVARLSAASEDLVGVIRTSIDMVVQFALVGANPLLPVITRWTMPASFEPLLTSPLGVPPDLRTSVKQHIATIEDLTETVIDGDATATSELLREHDPLQLFEDALPYLTSQATTN